MKLFEREYLCPASNDSATRMASRLLDPMGVSKVRRRLFVDDVPSRQPQQQQQQQGQIEESEPVCDVLKKQFMEDRNRFVEAFNFDVVNCTPLPGPYGWKELEPDEGPDFYRKPYITSSNRLNYINNMNDTRYSSRIVNTNKNTTMTGRGVGNNTARRCLRMENNNSNNNNSSYDPITNTASSTTTAFNTTTAAINTTTSSSSSSSSISSSCRAPSFSNKSTNTMDKNNCASWMYITDSGKVGRSNNITTSSSISGGVDVVGDGGTASAIMAMQFSTPIPSTNKRKYGYSDNDDEDGGGGGGGNLNLLLRRRRRRSQEAETTTLTTTTLSSTNDHDMASSYGTSSPLSSCCSSSDDSESELETELHHHNNNHHSHQQHNHHNHHYHRHHHNHNNINLVDLTKTTTSLSLSSSPSSSSSTTTTTRGKLNSNATTSTPPTSPTTTSVTLAVKQTKIVDFMVHKKRSLPCSTGSSAKKQRHE